MDERNRAGIAADAGLGVVFSVAVLVQALALADSWGVGYWWFGGPAAALVCGLAVVRRWRPAVLVAIVVAAITTVVARVADLPSEPGVAMALGLSVLVGAAVRTFPVRSAVAVAAGAAVVVAVGWVAARPDAAGLPPAVALNLAGWLTALVTGLCLRLLDLRSQAAAERVRRDERLELARELHDVVAHHVTGVVLQAQAARVVQRKHPERLDDSLTGIEAAGTEALAAMRQVVGLLRDTGDVVSAAPGPEPLGELVGRFPGPPVRLRLPAGEPAWSPEVTGTVYRVVQEALTNVGRHAPRARSVAVTIADDGQAVTVEVTDDGPAPTRYHHRRGYGLVGMRERVEALGGTLRAGPHGAGWSVRVVLPDGKRR
ncbi:sensor histidine kinase [Lentzea xinjiangensis]|uniref:sensor histidine kinase n=1 Tax=Lentzea xinjiangensis TaxID=402600 RepID=UPI001C4322C9|nr:histidine kinase [Lentzea xinjiangensis]